MKPWFVRLLGAPQAESEGVRAHLRSKLTWCVLASLLMEERDGWVARAALLKRFWPERDSGTAPLRMALSSLRKAFGPDCLETDGDRLRATPGRFELDLESVRELEAARSGSVLARLAKVDDLLRGELLEGCHDPDESLVRWIGGQRAEWNARCSELLLRLCGEVEKEGNRYAAFDAACRAVRFHPHNAGAWKVVWRLGREVGRVPDAQALHGALSYGEAAGRIAARERQAVSLTIREERAFQALLSARIDGLPSALRRAFLRLSILPAAFGVEMARQVCGVAPDALQKLAAAQLLEHAGDRYHMLEVVRQSAQALLPGATRRALKQRHAGACSEWLRQRIDGIDAPLFRSVEEAQPHMHALLEVSLRLDPPCEDLIFANHLRMAGVPCDTGRVIDYTARVARNESLDVPLRREAAIVCMHFAMDAPRFGLAAEMIETALTLAAMELPVGHLANLRSHAAYACHHAERYDDAIRHIREACRIFREHGRWAGLADALRFEGEILRSRGDNEGSLAVLEEAVALYRVADAPPLSRAEALYQYALTLRLLGRRAEALASVKASLQIRIDHRSATGTADCLREIAVQTAEHGEPLMARILLDHAALLYEQTGNAAGRAVVRMNLGDLLARLGRIDEARTAYEQARDYWEAAPNADWARRAREKLEGLSALNANNPE